MNLATKLDAFLFAHFDKLAHIVIGSALAVIGLLLGHTINHHVAFWLSLIFVITGALGKEIWDHYHPPHTADFWDFFWGMAGGFPIWLAFLLGWVI